MKLTKLQALNITRILAHYRVVCETHKIGYLNSPGLVDQLEEYLTTETLAPLDEACVTVYEEEPTGDYDPQAYVLGVELHPLKPAHATVISSSTYPANVEVMLEFETSITETIVDRPESKTDLLVSGLPVDNVTFIRRVGSELHVAENLDGNMTWHRFCILDLPSDWEILPPNVLIEIE